MDAASQGGSDGFFFHRCEMGSDALRAVADMLSMRHGGSLRLLYAKAKTEELLVSALSAAHPDVERTEVRLGKQDRKRITQAREILDRQFASPPSVSELARRIAVNRNKLTYGFRDMHGCSMSEYIAERRLETAWRLLKETELPVSHIAEDVGYNHLPSFSAAFKKRYRISARALRRSLESES
ncbi:AraC family transcriptional regulator [Hoeflea sp. CAU 1731]